MIIAEAPGKEEAEKGIPLIGPAGHELQLSLNSIGFHKYTFYITNVLKHRPPNNNPPQLWEKMACRPYLYLEIDSIKPKFILTLGKHAYEAVSIMSSTPYNIAEPLPRGNIITVTTNSHECKAVATYHPSYACLRNPSMRTIFEQDLKMLYDMLSDAQIRSTLDEKRLYQLKLVQVS